MERVGGSKNVHWWIPYHGGGMERVGGRRNVNWVDGLIRGLYALIDTIGMNLSSRPSHVFI